MILDFVLNGKAVSIDADPGRLLVELLREDLHLTGTKIGCEVGECGACTVIVDGRTVNSCLVPAAAVHGKHVETIEGVSPENGPLRRHSLRRVPYSAGIVFPEWCCLRKRCLTGTPTRGRRRSRRP